MAGKRRATSELNRDNWDQDEPAEESGLYRKASEDVLKKRVFKTAKRRITKPTEEGSMSAFNPASLANLTSKTNQPATQLFSFLSNIKSDESKTNGLGNKPSDKDDRKTDSSMLFTFGNKNDKSESDSMFEQKKEKTDHSSSSLFSFGNKLNDKVPSAAPTFSFGNTVNSLASQAKSKEKSTFKEKAPENLEQYYAKLKGLNESVSKWINKHVENNPLINLQPIFKDYEKFFDEIDKEYKSKIKMDKLIENENSAQISKSTETQLNTFKFQSSVETLPTSKSETPSTTMFKFGNSMKSDKETSAKMESTFPSSTFRFGNNSSSNNLTTDKVNQFSFQVEKSASIVPNTDSLPKFNSGANNSSYTGFTFNSVPVNSSPAAKINFGSIPDSTPINAEENKEDEDSEEPPKVEVKEVEEEGQIYTIKCKLFVKKDGNFVEKGIGNLFLKPVPESDKMQVIVRAHNSLANVLCNFILSKSIPTQRMGKNNVMIVCIPTPESKPPPIPVLIKVKSGEDADQLLETLEKHKK